MSARKDNIDVGRVLSEVKKGLPAAPGQLSAQEFSLLCENIANAIVMAIDMYDNRVKSPEPEYGEEERVV